MPEEPLEGSKGDVAQVAVEGFDPIENLVEGLDKASRECTNGFVNGGASIKTKKMIKVELGIKEPIIRPDC